MLTTVKLIGIATTLTAGLAGFTLLGLGDSSPASASPAVSLAYAADPAPATKPVEARPTEAVRDGVRSAPSDSCAKQVWPYVAPECLSAAAGTPVRKVSRTITATAAPR
jgi:hypothetical protein